MRVERVVAMPEPVGSIAFRQQGGLIAAMPTEV
jgi:hypothetical protein